MPDGRGDPDSYSRTAAPFGAQTTSALSEGSQATRVAGRSVEGSLQFVNQGRDALIAQQELLLHQQPQSRFGRCEQPASTRIADERGDLTLIGEHQVRIQVGQRPTVYPGDQRQP